MYVFNRLNDFSHTVPIVLSSSFYTIHRGLDGSPLYGARTLYVNSRVLHARLNPTLAVMYVT